VSRRLPAWLAVLFIVPAAVLPGGTAAAQVCGPPSAEHAFEELLDVATDDSPVEDEAWRIADEQEARGAFESPETIRMIDDLARANGFAYDCSTRMYHPVSGPDPREAIENDGAPEETGTGAPEGGTAVPGGGAPDGGSPASAGPVATGADDPGATLGPGGAVVDGGRAPVGVSSDTGQPAGTGQGTPATAGGRPVAGATGDGPVDDIGRPGGTDRSQGGAVALPGAPAPQSSGPLKLAGIVVLIGATVGLAAMARARRRRPELLN
jgi:hypothetical protein